jgi:O-antigen/teichoic acid export membrane protein
LNTDAELLPDPASGSTPAGAATPALGGSVFRGSFWMILAAVLTRCASFAAQIVLGLLLSQGDFGVYALAISAATIAAALKDGGVKQLLVQRQGRYGQLIGPVFWMAAAFNTATGFLIAVLAFPLASVFGEPQLAVLMLIIAAAHPLATPGAILATRLHIDMRFKEAGMIAGVSAAIRYVGAIILAAAGFGPLSFVLPLPILAIVEWAMGWWYTRERPWRKAPRFGMWWPMFLETSWILVGTFGIAVTNLGANPALGLFAATAVVGVYFFAFQIVVQVGVMLSTNVAQVLFSALAKLNHEPQRQRAAVTRAMRQVMLLAAPVCLGLAVTFAPLEALIWGGRWVEAVGPVLVLGFLYPLGIASSISFAVLQAKGRFRDWGLGLITMAVLTLGGALAGAWLTESAIGVAWSTGVVNVAAGGGISWWVLRTSGVKAQEIAAALFPAWLLGILAALTALWVDSLVAARLHSLLRLGITGCVFSVLYGGLSLVLLRPQVREAVAVLPRAVREPLGRILGTPGSQR